jgi:hypothetical protein
MSITKKKSHLGALCKDGTYRQIPDEKVTYHSPHGSIPIMRTVVVLGPFSFMRIVFCITSKFFGLWVESNIILLFATCHECPGMGALTTYSGIKSEGMGQKQRTYKKCKPGFAPLTMNFIPASTMNSQCLFQVWNPKIEKDEMKVSAVSLDGTNLTIFAG